MPKIIERTKLIIDLGLVFSIFWWLFPLIGVWRALVLSMPLLLLLQFLNKISRKKVLLPEIAGLFFACFMYFTYFVITVNAFGFSQIDNVFIAITGAFVVKVLTGLIAFVYYRTKGKQGGLMR